jgi:hypothetical protein
MAWSYNLRWRKKLRKDKADARNAEWNTKSTQEKIDSDPGPKVVAKLQKQLEEEG